MEALTKTQVDPAEVERLKKVVQEAISKYWPLEPDAEKLFATCIEKEEEYYSALERRGFFSLWRLIYSTYYGLSNQGRGSAEWQTQTITFYGDSGELADFSLNEFRSFVDQIVALVTKNRPSYQALAKNTDYESLAQVNASDALIKNFIETANGELKERTTVLKERLYGKSFTCVDWNKDAGAFVEYEETEETEFGAATAKKKTRSGTLEIRSKTPWLVVSEPTRSEVEGHLWRVVIDENVNKYDMMASYPVYAEQIEESDNKPPSRCKYWPGSDITAEPPKDACTVRTFYHARTASIPGGLKYVFVNSVLVDRKGLDTESIPVKALFTGELEGTCFGISNMWNMVPIEQLENQILSDIATNLDAFGRPPLLIPDTASELNLDVLANGNPILMYPAAAAPPSYLRPPEIPAHSFKVLEILRQLRSSTSGLNSVIRGEPSNAITSGAYAALYSQLAVESQSELQLVLTMHQTDIANTAIEYLKEYATAPQLIAIVGKDERPYLQYFTKDRWSHIQRVQMQPSNPALSTIAGRMQIVEALKNFPGIPFKNPEQIVELLVSGTWKPLLSPTRDSDMRIGYENEFLLGETHIVKDSEGFDVVEEIPVYPTDNAAAHIWGHLSVINSPAGMQNPRVRQAGMVHILEHIRTARAGDPYLAGILGLTPPEQQQPQPGLQEQAANGKPQENPTQLAEKKAAGPAPSAKVQSGAVNAMKSPNEDDSVGAKTPSIPSPSAPPSMG